MKIPGVDLGKGPLMSRYEAQLPSSAPLMSDFRLNMFVCDISIRLLMILIGS